jgi:hypothetical protein
MLFEITAVRISFILALLGMPVIQEQYFRLSSSFATPTRVQALNGHELASQGYAHTHSHSHKDAKPGMNYGFTI